MRMVLCGMFAKGQPSVLPGTDHLAPVSRPDWIAAQLSDLLSVDLDVPLPMDAD